MVFVHRFLLLGCNSAMLANLHKAAHRGIPGVELPVEENSDGSFIISVESSLGHLQVLNLISNVLAEFPISVCPTALSAGRMAEWA